MLDNTQCWFHAAAEDLHENIVRMKASRKRTNCGAWLTVNNGEFVIVCCMMVWNIQAGTERAKTDMSFDNYVANPPEVIQIDKNFN